MIRERFFFRETIATILADEPSHIAAAKSAILAARQVLEKHIARDPFFKTTFEPYDPCADEPVIAGMAGAARCASVGRMAAVAGTIAWAGLEGMIGAGADFCVIDNGGDIALFNNSREVRIGIHAGTSPLSDRFAFVVPPKNTVRGICTSSATVGPSVSFGVADAVTVFSGSPALADAWATAICNRIRSDDHSVLDELDPSQVSGVLAVLGNQTVRWGSLPPIVPAVVNGDLISAGDRL